MINRKWLSVTVLCLVGCLVAIGSFFSQAQAAEEVIHITGDGITTPLDITRSDLEKMQKERIQTIYSTNLKDLVAAEGIPLEVILKKAGLKPEANLIRVKGTDGYFRAFTVKELLQYPRYTYPKIKQDSRDGVKPVQTMIALKSGSGTKGFAGLKEDKMQLCVGQRSISDYNNLYFVRMVASIEVSTMGPEKYYQFNFKDISSVPWAQEAIEKLAGDKKVINGMNKTAFAPSGLLTRAQFAKMIVLAKGSPLKASSKGLFKDVSSKAWYAPYVAQAVKDGFIEGYQDGTFKPEAQLTKEEMITIVIRALDQEDEAKKLKTLTHLSQTGISSWARGYVELADQEDLLEYGHLVKGNQLAGTKAVTRAEAAETVFRMVSYRPKNAGGGGCPCGLK